MQLWLTMRMTKWTTITNSATRTPTKWSTTTILLAVIAAGMLCRFTKDPSSVRRAYVQVYYNWFIVNYDLILKTNCLSNSYRIYFHNGVNNGVETLKELLSLSHNCIHEIMLTQNQPCFPYPGRRRMIWGRKKTCLLGVPETEFHINDHSILCMYNYQHYMNCVVYKEATTVETYRKNWFLCLTDTTFGVGYIEWAHKNLVEIIIRLQQLHLPSTWHFVSLSCY